MVITLLGIVNEVRLVQPPNALAPISITLLGIFIDVKPVHPLYLQMLLYQRLVC